jgi:hypothetical protein
MRKLPALLFLTGLSSLALLSAPPGPTLRMEGRPLLPRPGLLKVLFKAQLGLVTDYFWLLTLNQIGSASTPAQYRDVYHYADLTTDLDPRFNKVYLFAGITIPLHMGRGEYANTEESTRLLRKGVANVPDDTRVRFQLAYNLMFFHRQYKEAAAIIEDLARIPGSPDWYPALATRLYAQSGDFDTSMSLTLALRDGTDDPETRAYYDQRVREILQERVLRTVDEAITRYRTREGRLPGMLSALVASGELSELPVDPLGGQLFIGEDGRAYSTAAKFRLGVILDERDDKGERIRPKPLVNEEP